MCWFRVCEASDFNIHSSSRHQLQFLIVQRLLRGGSGTRCSLPQGHLYEHLQALPGDLIRVHHRLSFSSFFLDFFFLLLKII